VGLGCTARIASEPAPDELDTDLTTTTYQAENAAISGAIVGSANTGFTGTGYVDYQNASGDFIDWTVNIATTGDYNLVFRFANAATTNRPLKLTVDGTTVNASVPFNPTGSWTTWTNVTQKTKLTAGTHHVRTTAIGSSGPNIDRLQTSGPLSNFPSRFAAPYVETWNDNNLATLASSTGHKFYTLAFVLNGGGTCNPTWNGDTSLTGNKYGTYIGNLRNLGGDVIVSFGGADGTELGLACGTVSSLQAAYQKVITQFGLTWIDLDIESGAQSDTASIDRRNKALHNLQSANPSLKISYTLEVERNGLPSADLNLLKNAQTNGVRVDVVNIMAMDYGPCYSDMGQAAIDAANATRTQLANIGLSAKVGVTPMIGINDVTCENFTTSNAQQLESFAQSNSFVATLGYWALGSDPNRAYLNIFHPFH
jgi:chitinase